MAQNARYNIELFEPAAPRNTSTAPKINPNNSRPNLRVVEKPRMTASQVRAQNVRAFWNSLKIVGVAAVCLLFLGVVIYSTLKLDEINRDIASIDKSMSIAKSEKVRLDMELDSIVSLDKVESYAVDTLGMSKVQDYQVVYVDLSSSDRIIMAGGKETDSTNVINSEDK